MNDSLNGKQKAGDLPYRLSVGMVLFNRQGKVWIGSRVSYNSNRELIHTDEWQFPQGGIEESEKLKDAALRELYEETSIKSVSFLSDALGPLCYDFPPQLAHLNIAKKYRGQKQYWFALLFTGDESEIDIENLPCAHTQEFGNWRWEDFENVLKGIVYFKKDIYDKLYQAFRIYEDRIKQDAYNS